MRRLAAAVCAAWFFFPAAARAQSPAVTLTAQQIALYADRGLLVAGGGVAARVGGMEIDATRAMYDLRADRLTAAGDVTVKNASGTTVSGTGYVYDFKKKSGEFVEQASVPQFPTIDALVIGQQLELRPGVSMTFSNAQARSGTAFVPAATYTYDIPPPSAKDFGYSPVPSAALEWPLVVSSGRNGYTFARLRYDKYTGGPGTGMEEHYAATDRGYLALAQTLDRDGARYDLGAYQRINDTISQSLTGSMLQGTHAMRYALTSSGRYGFASLSFAQYNAQRSDDLLLTGNQRPIGGIGSVRLQFDLGHDVHPGYRHLAQDVRATPGLHFDTQTAHLGRASLSGSFDVGESVYDYGRGTLSSTAGVWSTFPVDPHLQLNGGATFSHDAPPFPSTYRTYTGGFTWKASRAFGLVWSLTYAHDFGQAFGSGRPQFSAAFDVQVRRRNGTGIEIGAILPFGGVGDMNRQAALNLRFLR